MLAEENWRRSRLSTSSHAPVSAVSINGQSLDKSYPQRNLRDLMEELRSSSSQNKNKGQSSQSQSEYTTACLIASSDSDFNDNDDEYEINPAQVQTNISRYKNPNISRNDTKQTEPLSQRSIRNHIAQRKKLPTPSPTAQVLGGSSNRHHRTDSKSSLDDSVYSTLSNDVYSKIVLPGDPHNHPKTTHGSDSNNVPFSPITKQHENRTPQIYQKRDQQKLGGKDAICAKESRSQRELLKERLKECALVSESGSASVIEVIEPTLSEEEDFQNSIREMSWNISFNTSRTINSEKQGSDNNLSHLPSSKNYIPRGSAGNSVSGNDIKPKSPITIYPSIGDGRSSIITINSSNSNTMRSSGSSSSSYSLKNRQINRNRTGLRPTSEVDLEQSLNFSFQNENGKSIYNDNHQGEDSGSNRYSTYSDVSPTKRLLEMGIATEALNDDDNGQIEEDEDDIPIEKVHQGGSRAANAERATTNSSLVDSSKHTGSNGVYVMKKKKHHPASIVDITSNLEIKSPRQNRSLNDTENQSNANTTSPKNNNTSSPHFSSSKITFTDLDFLQEHFVDESFDHEKEGNQFVNDAEDISKNGNNKKTTFLQKIANKTKKLNNMKKKMNTTNANKENVQTTTYRQHSINGSPLVLPRNGVLSEDDNDDDEDDEELEEHILPDSFEDLPGDSTDSLSFTAVNKEDPQGSQEINEDDKSNMNSLGSGTKSLSISSRKSMLFSNTSTSSSLSSKLIKNNSGISAASVASTSEDSGIGLIASSSSSSTTAKNSISYSNATNSLMNGTPKPNTIVTRDTRPMVSSQSSPHKIKTSIELTLTNGNLPGVRNDRVSLSKIDEASSIASQSSKSCYSESINNENVSIVSLANNNMYVTQHTANAMNDKNSADNGNVIGNNGAYIESNKISSFKTSSKTSVNINSPIEGSKLKRNSSSSRAWYDVPSDEDPEAPEEDSLASIISHRSHSSEED